MTTINIKRSRSQKSPAEGVARTATQGPSFDINAARSEKRRAFAHLAYAAYAWAALAGAGIGLALALAVTPGLARRRRLARAAARVLLVAIGSPVRTAGSVPSGTEPSVIVANHASYLDGIILTAALPPRFAFLIKHEMAATPIAGFVLRRLGSHFVDRESPAHRHGAVRRLVKATADGGPSMKRVSPRAMGRAFFIKHRTSHLTIELSDETARPSRAAQR